MNQLAPAAGYEDGELRKFVGEIRLVGRLTWCHRETENNCRADLETYGDELRTDLGHSNLVVARRWDTSHPTCPPLFVRLWNPELCWQS